MYNGVFSVKYRIEAGWRWFVNRKWNLGYIQSLLIALKECANLHHLSQIWKRKEEKERSRSSCKPKCNKNVTIPDLFPLTTLPFLLSLYHLTSKQYGKKKTLPDTDCIYHHSLARTGNLYSPVRRDQRHDHCFDSDVGCNRIYSDLQKSKKIAFLVTKIRKTSEKFS